MSRLPFRSTSRFGGILKRFSRRRDGTTAVEFALVLGPFLFALFATLEIAMVFWQNQILETGVANAARLVYTGQFQTDTSGKGYSAAQLQAQFKAKLCENITAVIDCANDVSVDVREVTSFSGASGSNPINAQNKYDTSSYSYGSVGRQQIGVITASFEYKSFFPAINGQKLANGNRLILATAVFKTEPY